MLDIAAITVAVISLIGSMVATAITSWSMYNLDKRKSIRDAEALLRKYQDPLLLAARDLQSRLYNILFRGVLSFGDDGTTEEDETLYIYTAFLVGQYFAWIHIQRQQGQFMALTGEHKQLSRTKDVIKITNQISELLNTADLKTESDGSERLRDRTSRWWLRGGRRFNSNQRDVEQMDVREGNADQEHDQRYELERSFVLWRDHQRAIGEIMTEKVGDTNELVCINYTKFLAEWREEGTVCTWLSPVSTAIERLVKDKFGHDHAAERYSRLTRVNTMFRGNTMINPQTLCRGCAVYNLKKRLLRLQHLLVDLISLLDDEGLVGAGERSIRKGGQLASPDANSCTCNLSQHGSDHRQERQLAPGGA